MRAIANGILPETDVMYQNYLNDDKVQSEYTEAKKDLRNCNLRLLAVFPTVLT